MLTRLVGHPTPRWLLPARLARAARTLGLLATLAGSALSAQAALTINSIDVPTRLGRGETVPGLVSYTRSSGSGPETITIVSPAVIDVVAPLPASCTLAGASGSIQTMTCTGIDPGGLGALGTLAFNVRGLTLGGGNVTASNAGPPLSQASDSFSVVSGGDLSLVKTVSPSATFINGQSPSFTLTPSIAGDAVPAGSVITITDQLPGSVSEFTLSTVTAPGFTCNSAAAANTSRTLTCTITGPLTSLPAITLQGKLTLGGAGGLRNNASIAPDGTNYIDTNPANNAPFVDITINNGADPRPTGSFPASALVSSPQTLVIN